MVRPGRESLPALVGASDVAGLGVISRRGRRASHGDEPEKPDTMTAWPDGPAGGPGKASRRLGARGTVT